MEREFLARTFSGIRQRFERLQRRRETINGLGIGRAPRRLLSGQGEVLHRLDGIATVAVMMRKRGVVIFEARLIERFQRERRAFMQKLAALLQHGVVGHLLRECVLENVFDLGEGRLLVEELLAL